VKRDELDIELVGNEVAITGELKEKERTGVVRRRTRRTGRFDYRVTLPERVDAEQIDASLDNGVLTVLLPKSERAQRRKIAIKDS
jgi:HSP20 family protein